jgi:hypothetical protein
MDFSFRTPLRAQYVEAFFTLIREAGLHIVVLYCGGGGGDRNSKPEAKDFQLCWQLKPVFAYVPRFTTTWAEYKHRILCGVYTEQVSMAEFGSQPVPSLRIFLVFIQLLQASAGMVLWNGQQSYPLKFLPM